MTGPGWGKSRVLPFCFAAALVFATGCNGRRPDLIVIVADTLRADRLGSSGNSRGLTPFLDQLAARGARFASAYAPCSWTNPSIASLFTSRYPTQHGVVAFDTRLRDEEVTLGERLAAVPYLQLGFVANFRLSESLGFAQGFNAWFPYVTEPKPEARILVDAALEFLDRQWKLKVRRRLGLDPPVHLYLHFMETHAPYLPPEPFYSRFAGAPPDGVTVEEANHRLITDYGEGLTPMEASFLERLYDAEVATLDAELARLFSELERRGFLRNALIVVTADHGEQFREHGQMGHGVSLWNELLRVPLLMVGPGIAPGTVLADNVSLVDVAPTVLEVVGLLGEPRFEGQSLLPQLRGEHVPARDVLAELPPTGEAADSRRHSTALVRGLWKLLRWNAALTPGREFELYDLASDVGEHSPDGSPALVAAKPTLIESLAERTAELAARGHGTPDRVPVDDATRARLRALGYVH